VLRFLNERRSRDYPRLMLLVVSAVLLLDVGLRQGWRGGLGQIIGSDFITLYAAGSVYRTEPAGLYDFSRQHALQQSLITPTPLTGLNPFISPPYVAQVYALLTILPLPLAFVLISIASLALLVGSVWLLVALHTAMGSRFHISRGQLGILALSSFAFIEGFRVGQNHTLALLLVSAICLAMVKERWALAGALAGLLIYKPQFVLGFLILWLIWGRLDALLSFGLVVVAWVGSAVLATGLDPYLGYLGLQGALLRLPYVEGFPSYLMVTPYGLLATLLPESALPLVQWVTRGLAVAATLLLMVTAYRLRQSPARQRVLGLAAAVLFPLLVAPYTLLHDLLLLIPIVLLLAAEPTLDWPRLRTWAALAYAGALFLPLLGYIIGVALPALLPLSLAVVTVPAFWCLLRGGPRPC